MAGNQSRPFRRLGLASSKTSSARGVDRIDPCFVQDPSAHHDDAGTETYTKKSDEKSPKKAAAPASLTVPKDASVANKAATGKENRAGKVDLRR